MNVSSSLCPGHRSSSSNTANPAVCSGGAMGLIMAAFSPQLCINCTAGTGAATACGGDTKQAARCLQLELGHGIAGHDPRSSQMHRPRAHETFAAGAARAGCLCRCNLLNAQTPSILAATLNSKAIGPRSNRPASRHNPSRIVVDHKDEKHGLPPTEVNGGWARDGPPRYLTERTCPHSG